MNKKVIFYFDSGLCKNIFMEYTTLRNGLKMPMLGFGVFQVAAGKECKDSVLEALKCGC